MLSVVCVCVMYVFNCGCLECNLMCVKLCENGVNDVDGVVLLESEEEGVVLNVVVECEVCECVVECVEMLW